MLIDQDLRIVDWPRESAELTGVSREEALGKFCWQLVYPNLQSMPESCSRACQQHSPVLHNLGRLGHFGDAEDAPRPKEKGAGAAILSTAFSSASVLTPAALASKASLPVLGGSSKSSTRVASRPSDGRFASSGDASQGSREEKGESRRAGQAEILGQIGAVGGDPSEIPPGELSGDPSGEPPVEPYAALSTNCSEDRSEDRREDRREAHPKAQATARAAGQAPSSPSERALNAEPLLPHDPADAFCAAISLPEDQGSGNALIWMRSWEPQARERVDPMERIIIRGCMSERLGDLPATLDFLRRYAAADDCELFVVDANARDVVLKECMGVDVGAFRERSRIPLGAGYPGGVTQGQSPWFTNDFPNDRRFLRESVRRCGLNSFLGLPLSYQQHSLGYLGLGWRDPRVAVEPMIALFDDLKPLLIASLGKLMLRKPKPKQAPMLEISSLGRFEIRLRGEVLAPNSFSRRKALEVLQILLLKAPSPIHRDQLMDLLWPEVESDRGNNRLHGVVHSLRRALGSEAQELIVCEHGMYSIRNEELFVDLWEFRRLLARSRQARAQSRDLRIVLLEELTSLYQGELFPSDLYSEWAVAARAQVKEQYLDAVRVLARLYEEKGQPIQALRILGQALEHEPLAEDLQLALLRLLKSLGRHHEAGERYQGYVHLLRRELDADPGPELRQLFTRQRWIGGGGYAERGN